MDFWGLRGQKVFLGGLVSARAKLFRNHRNLAVWRDVGSACASESLMIFRHSRRKLWDTWIHVDPDHPSHPWRLFFLVTDGSPGDAVCGATALDGLHWRELTDPVIERAAEVWWIGSGDTWQLPDGRWAMSWSEWYGPAMLQGQQVIRIGISVDLQRWQALPEPFVPDTRWYLSDVGEASRWDCLNVAPNPSGGWWGAWSANPASGAVGFGLGCSEDGLSWQALPPPIIDWGDATLPAFEVGGLFEAQGCWWLLGGCFHGITVPDPVTGEARRQRGMIWLTADRPTGTWRLAPQPFLLLSRDLSTYFVRVVRHPKELLVCHHSLDRHDERWLAPLKRLVTEGQEQPHLAWWPGNDGLRGAPVLPVDGAWSVPDFGLWIEGTRGDCVLALGVATLVLGASHTALVEDSRSEWSPIAGQRLRLLVRGALVEVYRDDRLAAAWNLPAICSVIPVVAGLRAWCLA
jgi:hypothetical protein